MKHNYLLLLLCCFAISFSQAQIVNIPDPVWKSIIISLADTNNDGEIQVDEAEAYTGFLGGNSSSGLIYDITGYEVFVNISNFSLEALNNNIYVSEIDLSQHTQITSIQLYGLSELHTLITGQNNVLEKIEIGSNINVFTNLNVTQNPALKELIIGYAQIANIDLTQNNNLQN